MLPPSLSLADLAIARCEPCTLQDSGGLEAALVGFQRSLDLQCEAHVAPPHMVGWLSYRLCCEVANNFEGDAKAGQS